MIQILPAAQRRPSFAQNFNQAIGQGLNYYQQQQAAQQKAQQLSALAGQDISALPPELQKIAISEKLKGQKPLNPLQQAQADLANQKTKYYQSQSELAQKLRGNFEPENTENVTSESNQNLGSIKNWSDEQLIQAAGYAGQHGEMGNIGKSAELELKNRQEKIKSVGSSFKENQKFIDKTYDQYEDSLRKEAVIARMNQLEESGELSESGIINALESLGMKPEWLKNPANEEYTKLGLDLLGGGTLQADYGNRVLASEFKVSQMRIPTLSQTPEGRRQIAENIMTMLLPSKLKKERMQYYIDRSERTGEPLPHDLRGKILKDIKPQLEEAYDKFKQRNGRYKVKEGTYPDNNALEKYYYLGNGDPEKIKQMMKEDGYDIGNTITSKPKSKRAY